MSAERLPRVCLVVLTDSASGTERIAYGIAESLAACGVAPDIIIPEGDSLNPYAASFGAVARHIERIGPVTSKASVGRNAVRTLQHLASWKPDVVHFHCPSSRWGVDTVLATRFLAYTAVVRTEHNPLMSRPGGPLGAAIRAADRGVDTFSYVSRGNQTRFEEMLPARVGRGVVIPNAIDAARFRSRQHARAKHDLRELFRFPGDAKVAIAFGTIGSNGAPRRSVEPILEAFAALLLSAESRKAAQNWRLLVVGADGLDAMKSPLARALGSFVAFGGFRNDLDDLLPQCDLYLSASQFEGLSLTMLEAWACGIPVLAMEVDGIEDVVGKAALDRVVVPRDPMALGDAWRLHMEQPCRLKAFTETVQRTVLSRFTTQKMIGAYLGLYEARAGERRQRPA